MTIKITHQDKERTINLSQLPVFEENIATLLKTTNVIKQNLTLKDYNYALTGKLKGRAEAVETVSEALKQIQEHKTREVIYACLKTAVACAIIAGIVLCAVLLPGEIALLAIVIGIVGSVVSSYITEDSLLKIKQFNQEYSWDVKTRRHGIVNPLCLATAPFMSLYEVFTRQARIERVQNKQNTELNKDLIKFFEFAAVLSVNLENLRRELQEEKTRKNQHIESQKPNLSNASFHKSTNAALITLESEIALIDTTLDALTTFEHYKTT